jgi:hypothetical protein
MADRVDFHFRQRVTEAELDLGFQLLEEADRRLVTDLGFFGVVRGLVPSEHQPLADLSVDLSSPGTAYDRLGRRVFLGTDQTIDCSVDHQGIPTAVQAAGGERWLGVFIRFERALADLRTDGNGQQIYFRRSESLQFVVRQGAEDVIGSASPVPLQPDEVLLFEVRLENAQDQIQSSHISVTRRQALTFAPAQFIGVDSSGWVGLAPAQDTVQAALDAVDDAASEHFTGSATRHPSEDVTHTGTGFLLGNTVREALEQIPERLMSRQVDGSGAQWIGSDEKSGSPHTLDDGNVHLQLAALLGWLNAHLSAGTGGAHSATSISASGAPGTPYSIPTGNVMQALIAAIGAINFHAGGGDHDGRYYRRTEQVSDADTVDGQHASEFSGAGHAHDERYVRQLFTDSRRINTGQTVKLTTLPERPDLVAVSYNRFDSGGAPLATTYVRGTNSAQLRAHVTKVDNGGGQKDFEVFVFNNTGDDLMVNTSVYGRDL